MKKYFSLLMCSILLTSSLTDVKSAIPKKDPTPIPGKLKELKKNLNSLQKNLNSLKKSLKNLKAKLSQSTLSNKNDLASLASGRKETTADSSKAISAIMAVQEIEPEGKLTPYQALGIAPTATSSEIARGYKRSAMKWHPDKWSGASADEKALATQNFQRIHSAYVLLSNPATRAFYDRTHKGYSEQDVNAFNDAEQQVKQIFNSPQQAADARYREKLKTLIDVIKSMDPERGNLYQAQFDKIVAQPQKNPQTGNFSSVHTDTTKLDDAFVLLDKNPGNIALQKRVQLEIDKIRATDPDTADIYQEAYEDAIAKK